MLTASIIGNLGADAKTIVTQSGKFVSLSVATNRKYHNKNGDLVEELHWVNVNVNFNIDGLLPYLIRGTKIMQAGE